MYILYPLFQIYYENMVYQFYVVLPSSILIFPLYYVLKKIGFTPCFTVTRSQLVIYNFTHICKRYCLFLYNMYTIMCDHFGRSGSLMEVSGFQLTYPFWPQISWQIILNNTQYNTQIILNNNIISWMFHAEARLLLVPISLKSVILYSSIEDRCQRNR